ncbi:MAG TPA: extracellular solute-binding protein [Pseudomonas sp.]|nr:extracellular solute-binding protein [Pseudomonas sp.]
MRRLLYPLLLVAGLQAQAQDVIRFYSWKDYFDPAVLKDFEAQTGIRVDYQAYTTVQELNQALRDGEAYDLIVPSHFMLKQLIAEQRLTRLDVRRLPSYSQLDPWLLSMLAGIPAANQYSVPYLWGSIGLAINTQTAQAIYADALPNSWALLFDEAHSAQLSACGIGLPDAPEEVTSVLLNYQGRRLSASGNRQIARSVQTLTPLAPLLRALDNWEHIDALAAGRLCLAMTWSGHALKAMHDNPRLTYRIPQEGSAIYIDTLAIPSNASQPELAYRLIDFLIAPDNIVRNALATKFYAPLPSDATALQTLIEENPLQVLSPAQRRRSYLLESLLPAQKQTLEQSWQQFKSAASKVQPTP